MLASNPLPPKYATGMCRYSLKCVFLSAAHIRGTEIIAQKTFILTQEEIEIKFEGYRLQLHVPANSLPAEVSETQLNVQVSLSGPFQIPSNSELLSAVYWIFSPTKFAKPITVRIQHCAALSSDKVFKTNIHTRQVYAEEPSIHISTGFRGSIQAS